MFRSQTVTLDTTQTFILAKTKLFDEFIITSYLRTKERKTSLLKLPMQNIFSEVFCSDTVALSLSNQHSTILPLSFYNCKKLNLYKLVYKNLFLIKNMYFFDNFLGGFFSKIKLHKSFLCFRFPTYFKINLFLPLDLRL